MMRGCLNDNLAHDDDDANALCITDIWLGAAAHAASLELLQVRTGIAQRRPLIAGTSHTTAAFIGYGLAAAR